MRPSRDATSQSSKICFKKNFLPSEYLTGHHWDMKLVDEGSIYQCSSAFPRLRLVQLCFFSLCFQRANSGSCLLSEHRARGDDTADVTTE